MTQFMRAMGATARHRNIKIILLGQGKDLADLGLSSSTARNNYALIRVARDNATNRRSAWIDAGGREQAMDIRYVPMLAQRAAQRARLWLSHRCARLHAGRGCAVETLFLARPKRVAMDARSYCALRPGLPLNPQSATVRLDGDCILVRMAAARIV